MGKSTRWFFKNAKAADKGQSSAQLAQDVERSAYPDKYGKRDIQKTAGKLLRQYSKGGSSTGGSSKGGKKTLTQTIPGQDQSIQRTLETLSYFRQKRGKKPIAGTQGSRSVSELMGRLTDLKDTPDRTRKTKIDSPKARVERGGGGNAHAIGREIRKSGSFPLALSTGGTARRDFKIRKDGTVYIPATGKRVKANKKVLTFARDLAKHGVPINAFGGGKHSSGSQHYDAKAIDVPPGKGRKLARKHGLKLLAEGSHDHFYV